MMPMVEWPTMRNTTVIENMSLNNIVSLTMGMFAVL
jgi:hypothetical protein